MGSFLKFCFDQKLLQLSRFSPSPAIAKRNVKIVVLGCIRVRRALKQLVLALRLNDRFRLAKKKLLLTPLLKWWTK